MFGLFRKKEKDSLHNTSSKRIYYKVPFQALPEREQTSPDNQINDSLLFAYLNQIAPVELVDTITTNRSTIYHFNCCNFMDYSKVKRNIVNLSAAMHKQIKLINSTIALFALEIDHDRPTTIYFQNCVKRQQDNGINCLLGIDSNNNIQYISLEKAPHILIAGQTGSGKSVLENSIICSLLMEYSPEQLQMIMIDLKRVELSQYVGLPHLISPIITSPEKALIALNYTVSIMEQRYKEMEKLHLKEGKGYYSSVVVVIDELAELMLSQYRKPIETALIRIAQLGRAANIHLILATQRPTVNVITGLIKANIPCRIALNVASVRDSMTIIDHKGAEMLKGNGDGLYKGSQSIEEIRFQSPYIDNDTIQAIVKHWTN